MHAFGDISFVFSCSTVDKTETLFLLFGGNIEASLRKCSYFLPGKRYSCQGIGIPAREMGCFLGISPASNSTPRILTHAKGEKFRIPLAEMGVKHISPVTNCISLA